MQKTQREGTKGKKRQTGAQEVTGGQNQSENSRKVGNVGAQEEEKGANEKKSDGKTMHSKNSQAGVYLMHLHFGDAEIAQQGENISSKASEAEVKGVGYEPRLPA